VNITIRQGEELAKIFDGNEYVAYLEQDGTLFGFSKNTGYAQFIASGIDYSEAVTEFRKWSVPAKKKRRSRKEELLLIKNLAAIVALTQPKSTALKRALKYLEGIE